MEDVYMPLLTKREIAMLRVMNEITEKVNWESKVFDEEIVKKWKSEILNTGLDFSESMANYCIAELRHETKVFNDLGTVIVFNGDVVKSDTRISLELKKELQSAVKILEDVEEKEKDWHPGSNEQVLDLVHPSLFPLVYGRSHILKDDTVARDEFLGKCGKRDVIPVPITKISPERPPYYVSRLSTSCLF